jgi:hypothetical protein
MVAVCRSSRRICLVPGGCQVLPSPVDPYNTASTLPLWFTLLGGRLYGRCASAVTLAHHLRHSCRWWVPTRGDFRWEGQIGAPTSKVLGTEVLTKIIRTWFSIGNRYNISVARPCRSSRRGSLPLCWCRAPAPMDGYAQSQERLSTSSEGPPYSCFPVLRRQPQHPRPTADPSVSFSASCIAM